MIYCNIKYCVVPIITKSYVICNVMTQVEKIHCSRRMVTETTYFGIT